MKENISRDAINQFKFVKVPRRYIYHKFLRKIIILVRIIRTKFYTINFKKYYKEEKLLNIFNLSSLKNVYHEFQKNKYAFGEDLIRDSYLVRLLSDWPPIYFFKPHTSIYKSYDTCFFISDSEWKKDTKFSLKKIKKFPLLNNLYKIVSSNEFANAITQLCDDEIERFCYSFLVTQASEGSGLIQHMDGVADMDIGSSFLNLIIFLDGTDPPIESGGTSIYSSESPESLISSPQTLKNSFLIYKSAAKLFHGFPPMKKGKKRKALLVQFADKRAFNKKIS